MADKKDLRDGRDRDSVSGSDDYEVRYFKEKMNVSAEEVRKAIKEVGNNREKLEEYFRSGKR
jgi:hypothetical protein